MPSLVPTYESSPPFDGMAVPDGVDWFAATSDAQGSGVISGMAVTQDTGADLKVAVAAGVVSVAGDEYTYAGTGGSPVAIAAASTGDRRDTVVARLSAGTISVVIVQGTPTGYTAGNWTKAAGDSGNLPPVKNLAGIVQATDVVLAEVYVAGSGGTAATVITTATNLWDKRNILGPSPLNLQVGTYHKFTTNGETFTVPVTGIYEVGVVSGGGQGGGAGTAASTATAQAGAGGGASGAVAKEQLTLVAGTVLTFTLGAGGTGAGVGGATGGNAGTDGANGAASSMVGSAGTIFTLQSAAGGGGIHSTATSSTAANGGVPGVSSALGGGGAHVPGAGGLSNQTSAPANDQAAPGGGGGGPAQTTGSFFGGSGGQAGVYSVGSTAAGTAGGSGAAQGGDGAAGAANTGAGGGGGGGANGANRGGNGGVGGSGFGWVRQIG